MTSLRMLACCSCVALAVLAPATTAGSGPSEVTLPSGVKAVWDLGKAHRDKTATRERVCLNGLWRWQPAKETADAVPSDKWGYFQVPGFWPGTNNYLQEDS